MKNIAFYLEMQAQRKVGLTSGIQVNLSKCLVLILLDQECGIINIPLSHRARRKRRTKMMGVGVVVVHAFLEREHNLENPTTHNPPLLK